MAAARLAWRARAGEIDPARLTLIDESGFDTRLIRTHARAPRGQRAHGTVPGGHWQRLTLIGAMGIGAMGLAGLCAAMTAAAATGTAVFLAFIEQMLIPALKRERPDAVGVMDNLAAHKAACVREALDLAIPGALASVTPQLCHAPGCPGLVASCRLRSKLTRTPL